MVIKIRNWESNLEKNRQKSLFDVEAVENDLDMLFSSFVVEVVTGKDDLNNILENIETEMDIPDVIIISTRWLLTSEYKKVLGKVYKCSLKFGNSYILFDNDILNQLRQIWLKIVQNDSDSYGVRSYIVRDDDSKQKLNNILSPFF